ncbi:acyltransferase family protein [Butyrivibrio sp. VCD2006]|uniref:acyltransferase family protein n=1 Tax=Butyrivibrio sp. VCD2006 TaxID=1280664 RepID=UPI0003F4F624|nr:acyltransferase [Butyrivibrio sp. VCD2006]
MRKTYLDNIKWITVVIVVLYHVIYMYNAIVTSGTIGPFSEVQYQDIFQYIVYPWFMVLLFVVSGMSARFALTKHTAKEFIATRTVKYLVPSTLGLPVFYWILGYYNMQIGHAFDTMGDVPGPVVFLIMALSGTAVMWYIQLLWLYSVILVLVRKIEKDRLYNLAGKSNVIVFLALMPVMWGAANILNTPIVVVYRFGIYGVAFFAGYFIFSHDEVMDRLEKLWLPLTVISMVLAVIFTVVFWGQHYPDHVVLDTFLCNLYAWAATLAVLAFMKKWGNFSNDFTAWMGKKSWGLYMFHYLPIAMIAYYTRKYLPGMAPVLVYLLTTFGAFAGAYLLYEIISRVPVLRWFVLGISRKKVPVGSSERDKNVC